MVNYLSKIKTVYFTYMAAFLLGLFLFVVGGFSLLWSPEFGEAYSQKQYDFAETAVDEARSSVFVTWARPHMLGYFLGSIDIKMRIFICLLGALLLLCSLFTKKKYHKEIEDFSRSK